MTSFIFALDDYLGRLRYSGVVQPTAESLFALHRAQLFAIPFENFDILLGRGISLEPAKLFDKLVNQPRGGYCFELNGLFLMALQAVGFQARPLLARVYRDGVPMGRSHQVSLVTLGGRKWIADVGFGGVFFPTPLLLELNKQTICGDMTFRFVAGGKEIGIILQKAEVGSWQNVYGFDLRQVFPIDIVFGNHYTATHSSSFFVHARIAVLPNPCGVTTLFNKTLKITQTDQERMITLHETKEYIEALQTYFGIVFDASSAKLFTEFAAKWAD